MLLIVAVLGVFLVNSNAFRLVLEDTHYGGILTSDFKKAFIDGNNAFNGKMEWDDHWAKIALREASLDKYEGVEQPLIIYHKWNFPESHKNNQSVMLPYWVSELLRKYGKWVEFLPAKTRYGCNGVFDLNGPEFTAVCVYNVK
ncbi:hypothetical protein GCK32_016840 [Trichostrongylus colubriformis]|uniref:SCP domain-containing protein n=1 Tax=Trichostrongylus colubriformis TaxID=6319 RepID=A0AAN8EYS7_TRICO